MASQGPSFGLSKDCHEKAMGKFDVDQARVALHWIEDAIEEKLEPSTQDIETQEDVRDALMDGQALCKLINVISPDSVKKINSSKLPFKQMENIEMFLRGCKNYGMKELDSFQTQDLYETKAVYSVINCLFILGSLAQKNGYDGPTIGVKLAEQNVRNFSEEQVQQGKLIINLQYGSNQGASQAGMSTYGSTRKM